MQKKNHGKLRSQSGETLAEVLVALLIIALSGMLLAVMLSTAASMDIATRSRDKRFYEDLTRAETRSAAEGEAAGGGTIVISEITDGGSVTLQEIEVTTYGGNGLTSYEKAASTDDGGA